MLDDGNMLVGRSVIYGIHAPGPHYIHQPRQVPYGTEDRNQLDAMGLPRDTPLELDLDVVEIELAVLEQQQRLGSSPQNLPAQFRTDRTTGASDHHHLVLDATLEQLLARRNRITTQQVGDIDFLDVINLDPATGQIHEPRNAAYMQGIALQSGQNLATTNPRNRRNGQ
ncbi:hypothetical protein D3C78_1183360 [compost metagenome]